MKRNHEVLTKIEFDKLLKRYFPKSKIFWKEVPQADEPPDWYLLIGNDRYAVEATTVFDQIECSRDIKYSSLGISIPIFKFIKDIERDSIKEKTLSGQYFINICPIPDFNIHKDDIRQTIYTYLRETKDLDKAEESELGRIRGYKTTIYKVNNDIKNSKLSTSIMLGGISGTDGYEGLSQLLKSILQTKSKKLMKINEPIILLLLDSYHLADEIEWISIIEKCQERKNFHSIFRIDPNHESHLLWSESELWNV